MNVITIAICDRNTYETENLKRYLEELISSADVRVFDSTDTLLQTFQKGGNPYKAVFLRMETQGMDGISAAREIRKKEPYVPLIFLSRSEKYYKEAFEVFAWQYLLTPVNRRDVERALSPLLNLWGNMEERVIHYRYRSQIYTIPHSRIAYISSNLHTVNFHLMDGTCAQCRGKLASFEEQLAGSSFIRCHQSFFVNMNAITSMKLDTFVVRNERIPISRSHMKETQQKYYEYLERKGKPLPFGRP